MSLTFEQPQWLWVLLLVVPAAWVGLRWYSSMSRVRRWTAVLFRAILIVMLAAMLAGASTVRRSAKLATIGVIDVSGSVRLFGQGAAQPANALAAAKTFFDASVAHRGPEDLAGLVAFDGRALAVAMPTRSDLASRSVDVQLADGTNIGAALKYAAAMIPPDAAGRLVLMSDGAQNAGDALAAARELAGGTPAVPIDVVPIRLSAGREVILESVDCPPRATKESPVVVRVSLLATQAAGGMLSLSHNGDPLDINGSDPGLSRRLALSAGRHVELISITLPPGQLHRFRAQWTPDANEDSRLDNNSGEGLTYSTGKGAVLLVEPLGIAGGRTTLEQTLTAAELDVTVCAPEGIPPSILELQAYDLIILDNIPAEVVREEVQKQLADHVERLGAGLVMVGGPDSFGAGGWKGSPIEPLLPVRLDLPEKLVQPDAAVVLVLDNSGSMGRRVSTSVLTQQEIANQAAAMAAKTLAKSDLLGVIVFNSESDVIVPLGPNTDPAKTADRILSIAPGGGTDMGPALKLAWDQLRSARAAIKHIIVMSDGRSMGAEALPALAQRMRAESGITVSTIGVGDDEDSQTMGAIAANTGGKYYQVTNPNLLPKFFLKAIRVVRTPLIREGEFTPVVLPSGSPLTVGLRSPPPLRGLVLTQRRPEPTITYAMAAPSGEPLLAHWNAGLGQVAVFTSDARSGGWAERWISWPGYSQLWTAIARTTARSAATQKLELTTEVVGDELHLRVDASDDAGKPLDLLTVPAEVQAPSGERLAASLAQTGPGVYEARVPASQTGNYIAILTPRLGDRRLSPVIGGASVASGIEFRQLATDQSLLERIASSGGGRVLNLDTPAEFFDRSNLKPREARSPIWRALLAWSLLVLLLDVGTRRIAWDRFVSREFGVDLKRAAAEAVAERGVAAAKAAARLREAPVIAEEGPKLSDEDAARLAEEAAERRRKDRLEALRALRESQQGELAVEEPVSARLSRGVAKEQPRPEKEEIGTDLLAAKRRAKERFGEHHEEGQP